MIKTHLIIVLLASHLFLSCESKKVNADFLIENINIVDVEKSSVQTNRYVAILDTKIIGIYNEKVALENNGKVIDGSNKYLIPGLWDMHLHYSLNHSFSNPLLIANGITGIREMWGIPNTIDEIRSQIISGAVIAPDIYTSGNIIDGNPPSWPWSSSVKNAEEAELEVVNQKKQGVDFIKIYSRLSNESYMAIAKKSKELGISFAGHLPDSVSIRDAINMGQHSIEHLNGILEACSSRPDELAKFTRADRIEKAEFLVNTFDRKLFDSLSNALSKSNTWISPTLTVLKNTSYKKDSVDMQDPLMQYMPKHIQQMWNPGAGRSTEFYEAYQKMFELQLSLLGELSKNGVKILAGTDASNPFCYPGFSLHDELQLMVEGGMTPIEALKSATLNPALFMGKEAVFGKVAVGQLSSLVILNANPLDDISNTKSIHSVFLRGKYLNRKKLDKLLEEAMDISSKIEN